MRLVSIAVLCAYVALAPRTLAGGAESSRNSSVFDFFRWNPRLPADLERALGHYERGDLFAALAAAERGLSSERTGAFGDDLLLVRGLALVDLGWRREAEQSFAALLERQEPSPYYPLALLGLVESNHAERRFEAVVEAYTRYWEKPWQGSSRRDRQVRNFLEAYGELRAPSRRLSEAESELLRKPTSFVETLQLRQERPSERVLYLAGLDLFRSGDFARSLAALDRIGLASCYFPFALFTGAQDLYALGEIGEARAKIELLRRVPTTTDEERALAERAELLLVQMLFGAGRIDDALAAAGRLGGDGRYALAARLLRAEIMLATEKPSLALAFYGDLQGTRLGPRLAPERALGVAEAYTKLGDFGSAVTTLSGAGDEVGLALERLKPPRSDDETRRLRAEVQRLVAANRTLAAARREQIGAGIRRVEAFKGPLSIGKLARIVIAPHRHTVLGEPVYDLEGLAGSERPASPRLGGGEGVWLRFLESPLRRRIEDAEELRARLDDQRAGAYAPLLPFGALLAILDGGLPSSDDAGTEAAARVANRVSQAFDESLGEIHIGPGSPVAAEVAALRRRLLAMLAERNPALDSDILGEARRVAREHLADAIDTGLRQLLGAEVAHLRALEFDLQTELSAAMLRENEAIGSSQQQP